MGKDYHITLATYFQSKPLYLDGEEFKKPNVRKLVEQPWQELEAAKAIEKQYEYELEIKEKHWNNVTNTLCNLDFIQAKAVAKLTYELVNEINNALEIIPDNAKEIAKEKVHQARMDKYTHDLIACANGEITIEELEIPESIIPWTEEQINAEIERINTNPNLTDRLMDFRNFLGQESGNLQNYASEFTHFTIQQAWNYDSKGPVGIATQKYSQKVYKTLLLLTQYSRPIRNSKPHKLLILNGHNDDVFTISISPNGKKAISGSMDNSCILWDLENGKASQHLIGHIAGVTAVAISPDSKWAISGSVDKTCILWDLESGKASQHLIGHIASVSAIAMSPNSRWAISGSVDKTCIIWDLKNGNVQQIFYGHTNWITSVGISIDGKQATSCSKDNTCIVWDLITGQSLQIIKGFNFMNKAVSISPDGKRAISNSEESACILWDLERGKALQTLRGHTNEVFAFALSPDSKRAISGSFDFTCILWDLERGQAIHTLYSGGVYTIAITPDCRKAISGGGKTCILWDLESGQTFKSIQKHYNDIFTNAITPDGKNAISGLRDNTCIFWSKESGQQIKTLRGHKGIVKAVAITPDGKNAISGSGDKTCILWDLENGQQIKTLRGHTDMVNAVAITSDGKKAISGSGDNTCILWNLENGEVVHTLYSGGVTSIAITPDGKRAITGDSKTLWDLETGKTVADLKGGPDDGFSSVAISPNGKQAISGYLDNSCILWDLKNGNVKQTLNGHTNWVTSVAFSIDGKRAISLDIDSTCILWDLENGQKLAINISTSNNSSGTLFARGIFNGVVAEVPQILNVSRTLLCSGIGVTTACNHWDYTKSQYQQLSADCPVCGNRFSPTQLIIDAIKEITKKAELTPDQSPCLELPDEAWEHPGLLSECPKCKEKLKFNPFMVLDPVVEKEMKYQDIFDKAEKAFEEKYWEKANDFYIGLVQAEVFDASYIRFNMAICRINTLVDLNKVKINNIQVLIDLLKEKNEKEKVQSLRNKLSEKLKAIEEENKPWWKKMFKPNLK